MNDATSRAQASMMAANETGGKAANSLAAARDNPNSVPDQLQAVTHLAGDAQAKETASDNMASAVQKYGNSMSPQQRDQFQKQSASLAAEAKTSREQAQSLINDMGARGQATGNANMLRGARDAQNYLDGATGAKPTDGSYTPAATQLHNAAKAADAAQPSAGGNPPNQTGGGQGNDQA